MLFQIFLLLVPFALCGLDAGSPNTPFLVLPQQSPSDPLNTNTSVSSNSLDKRWSCHAPKLSCGAPKGCYNPASSRYCASLVEDRGPGLCPLDMGCCGTWCCQIGSMTCFPVVDGVEGPWCWPTWLPKSKDQIPTSALVKARVTGVKDSRIKNRGERLRAPGLMYVLLLLVPFVLGNLTFNPLTMDCITMDNFSSTTSASIPGTTPTIHAQATSGAAEKDIVLSEKKGAHGSGGHGSRSAAGGGGGGGAHSGAARPTIRRLLRALVMLKCAVVCGASPAQCTAIDGGGKFGLEETLRVSYPNITHHEGHGVGPGGGTSRSSGSRPHIPKLFSLLLHLTHSKATPQNPLEQLEHVHRLEARWSCHTPKMPCGDGCYNANNSSCCYVPGWHATGICPSNHECCAGFCCDEGWTCHEAVPESASMCWPPGYTSTLAARATSQASGVYFAKEIAGDDVSDHGDERQGDGLRCASGICWDAIAYKVTSNAVCVAASFTLVCAAVLLGSMGIVNMSKQ
jgi:hypothetical protein